jgi:hypothetical protein
MTRFKDFGGNTNTDVEPVTFKLHGEEFTCVKQLQGRVLLDIVAQSGSDDPAQTANTLTQFFSNVLLEESLTRFNALINDREKIVSVETLAEIVAWLIEEYSDRPKAQQ